jgi:hypothetical protein
MRRLTLVVPVVAIVFASTARGQGTPVQQNEATTSPLEARFEILQSSFVARMTLRLDRYTGTVDQLVARADSTIVWQPIPRRAHRDPDTRIAGRATYQIFTSGIAARYTFLINVTTGATWELVEDPDAGWFWTPIF